MFNQLAGTIRLEHRHSDGSWTLLERIHHDPAEHDPERGWAKSEIYSCPTCDEQVRIREVDPTEAAARPGGAR